MAVKAGSDFGEGDTIPYSYAHVSEFCGADKGEPEMGARRWMESDDGHSDRAGYGRFRGGWRCGDGGSLCRDEVWRMFVLW